jgi:D-glycero-D-manno-heptose 1,7-bisphosphate phosphatase
MNKAVFLDRDGVINRLVFNDKTNAYESPKQPCDFEIFDNTAHALALLKNCGYRNIVVSNQPDFAKGKAAMTDLLAIADMLTAFSERNGGLLDESYYCYHHPNGIVPELTQICRCRKPGTLFVEQAIAKFDLDRSLCFFIGDRKTDMQCGQNAGLRTLLIQSKQSPSRVAGNDQLRFNNLLDAARWILQNIKTKG